MNARLRMMAESREIEAAPAPDREVIARWRKAGRTFADAGSDLGPESRLTLYYQAALQAATALIRAAGFRSAEIIIATRSKPCARWTSVSCRRSHAG